MSQVPASLCSSSRQHLSAVFRLQAGQEAKSSFSFQRGGLVRITSGLESLLNEVCDEQKCRDRLAFRTNEWHEDIGFESAK